MNIKNIAKNLQIRRKVCTFAAQLKLKQTKKHENDSKSMVVAQLKIPKVVRSWPRVIALKIKGSSFLRRAF